MVMRRGEVWWAALSRPLGSAPGYRRPVLILQIDEFNESPIRTVVVAAITSNTRLAAAPGNVLCSRRDTRLSKASVVNVSQVATIDKSALLQRVGVLAVAKLQQVEDGMRLVLGL
jgi:mRNA interferase MazF